MFGTTTCNSPWKPKNVCMYVPRIRMVHPDTLLVPWLVYPACKTSHLQQPNIKTTTKQQQKDHNNQNNHNNNNKPQ